MDNWSLDLSQLLQNYKAMEAGVWACSKNAQIFAMTAFSSNSMVPTVLEPIEISSKKAAIKHKIRNSNESVFEISCGDLHSVSW